MEMKKLAGIILGLAATVLIIIILFNITNPTKKGILSLFSLEGEKEDLVELNEDLPFFSEFVKNYQECKLSPSTECFCQLTNPYIPEKYVLEIENDQEEKKTTIRAYSNVELSDSCASLSPLAGDTNLKTIQKTVENDITYFEDVIFNPSTIKMGNEGFVRFKQSDFTPVNRLFLTKSTLCSSKDDMDFSKGFLYKFDQEKTALFSGTFKFQRCNTIPGSINAFTEFNDFVFKINECKEGPCSFQVNIPENFEISIENKKIILKYKGDELRSSEEIKKELCLFTHFSLLSRQEQQFEALRLSDYLQIDIYPSENRICFLPYDQNLLREKQIALSRAQL